MPEQPITLEIVGGPTITVDWTKNMNAQQVLETAYDEQQNPGSFNYALQYYGEALGYLVVMVNETYDSYISSAQPFFYWEFLVNDVPATKGIDNTIVSPGDRVTFQFERYIPEKHKGSTLEAKFQAQKSGR
jgi:hypothetical protein